MFLFTRSVGPMLWGLTLWIASVLVAAQVPGDVDVSFDPGSGVDGAVLAIVVQPDGKVLIGGNFNTVRGAVRNRIARLGENGAVDPSFDPGQGTNGKVLALVLQPDGKVLLAGEFTSVDGTERSRVARLNRDGRLDGSFDPGVMAAANHWGAFAPWVTSVAIQPDEKVLIGGCFTSINGTDQNGVARLRADGSLDDTFNPKLTNISLLDGREDAVKLVSVALLPDNKVVIAGSFVFLTPSGISRQEAARLNADGTVDTTFTPGPELPFDPLSSMLVQPDAKVLLARSGGSVTRLNPDGSVDSSFAPATRFGQEAGAPTHLLLQSDQKILIGGSFTNTGGVVRNKLVRLYADGSLDPSFTPSLGPDGSVLSLALQRDGKVLVAGFLAPSGGLLRHRLERLAGDGRIDTSFDASESVIDGWVQALAVQSDDKVLIAGDFTMVGREGRPGIARLNSSGTLDRTFAPELEEIQLVSSVVVRPDGRILIGGQFTPVAGMNQGGIARLTADGTLDPTFAPDVNGAVWSILLQPEGKVLIGGGFTEVNGTRRSRIARLNADGTLDGSFNADLGAIEGEEVTDLALQPDAKVLLAGSFTAVEGVSRNRIARLHSNGTLDHTFDPGAGANAWLESVVVQPDGKVLIAGRFSSFNGISRKYSARLDSSGILDQSFNPTTGDDGLVSAIGLQTDGRVLLGGLVNSLDGTTWTVGRFNHDGTRDRSFNPGTGANQKVSGLLVQRDGKVLIGGEFTSVNGIARFHLARLHAASSTCSLRAVRCAADGSFQAVLWGEPGRSYTIEVSADMVTWSDLITLVAASDGVPFTDSITQRVAYRFYRARRN